MRASAESWNASWDPSSGIWKKNGVRPATPIWGGWPITVEVCRWTTRTGVAGTRKTERVSRVVLPRDALGGKAPRRWPQKPLDGRLEDVAKAVAEGYRRLQMPLKSHLASGGGQWLGVGWAPWRGGGGGGSPASDASLVLPRPRIWMWKAQHRAVGPIHVTQGVGGREVFEGGGGGGWNPNVCVPKMDRPVVHFVFSHCGQVGLEGGGGQGGGGGGWHKALVVGSVSLWRRPLASRLRIFCRHPHYRRHPHCRGHPPAPGRASRMQLLPMASSPDGLISARDAVITKTPGWEVLTTTSTVSVTQGHGC